MLMLTIGDRFPPFDVPATVSTDLKSAFIRVTERSYPGKWLCVFFYPKDFSLVCPTEVKGFRDSYGEFVARECQVLSASIDSEFVHLAWRRDHKDLSDLPFPMLSDVKRELSQALGIIDRREGTSMRATFLVDPDGVIRYVDVTDLTVGRNVREVLRVLDALQTAELCPCNWSPGETTLKYA
jgi:lipoyl-dependent peroxiredoxin subunit C